MFLEQNESPRDENTSILKMDNPIQQLSSHDVPRPKPKMVTPTDRIKIISKRLATSAPVRRPIEIIEAPEYDPTIRKKRRTEHPYNIMLGRRLEAIREAKSSTLPVTCHLSDSDSDEDQPPIKTEKTPQPPTVSSDLNLSISSDSSIEEGEITVPSSNNNNNDTRDSVPSTSTKMDSDNNSGNESDISSSKDSVSSVSKIKPVPNTIPATKQSKSVNFDLNSNKICEYIPESAHKSIVPPYVPTPINRTPVTNGSIPRKDILFDLWQIIRKIDQTVGRDLENSMIRRGFLKARYPR